MNDHESSEARTDAAVKLSLGLLEPSEAERLKEHLRSGCTDCNAEASSFGHVAGALGMSATAVSPRSQLRQRLLQAVASLGANRDDSEVRFWTIVRTRTLPWQKTKLDGIWEKPLLNDPIQHRSTRLIKVDSGAGIPPHRHLGDEESLVLEGTGKFGDSTFGPGDYHLACSGSLHQAYTTEEGCEFLLFSGTEYEFPGARLEPSGPEQFKTVRSKTGAWKPVRAGLHAQSLFSRPASPRATTLLRLDAETSIDASELGFSEAYVLEGSAHFGSAEISAGDYLRQIEAGQIGHFQSQLGCTLLIRAV